MVNPSAGPFLPQEVDVLWRCAQHWRAPHEVCFPGSLDWHRVVELSLSNKMQTLLLGVLKENDLIGQVPGEAREKLEDAAARLEHNAAYLSDALRQYLQYAAERDQNVVVLKGLWLSEIIYGKASMRPGADIDLLVRKQDIRQSISILEDDMGYGTWWRPLLDDRYYQRHHLHQQRCNHDRSVWIEPHWMLDHPYTLFTVDYDSMFERAQPGQLWGFPVLEMSPPDLILSLSMHLVKHAVYLPSVVDRADIRSLIVADGMLMYFLDVAECIKHYEGDIDWDNVLSLAKESGTTEVVAPVLRVCRDFLGTSVPESILSGLGNPDPGRFVQWIMSSLADVQLAKASGQNPGMIWSFLLGYKASVVFRPIRLLDLLRYLVPPPDFLERRYGQSALSARAIHLIRACGQYVQVGWDTVLFTLKRRMEVRRLDRQGYVWPELPQSDG